MQRRLFKYPAPFTIARADGGFRGSGLPSEWVSADLGMAEKLGGSQGAAPVPGFVSSPGRREIYTSLKYARGQGCTKAHKAFRGILRVHGHTQVYQRCQIHTKTNTPQGHTYTVTHAIVRHCLELSSIKHT